MCGVEPTLQRVSVLQMERRKTVKVSADAAAGGGRRRPAMGIEGTMMIREYNGVKKIFGVLTTSSKIFESL